MNTQPTALRLADAIMLERPNVKAATRQDAAAKLRHLHSLNQELVEALEGLMPYIATQATGCYGDKCREPWCFSCNGADDAFAAAEKGQDACAKASEVLAKHKEQA